MYKGKDRRSKAKHIYARAVPFLRHASRKRHFTQPNDSDDERKRALMLVIQPLLLSAFSSLYWQSLGNPPGDARAEEKPLPTLSGSYFVTANPRYIYSALADAAPIGDARSSRDPLPLRDKFSHFDIPAGRIQRGRVRLRTRRACSATMHRRRYKARGGMHPQRQMQ